MELPEQLISGDVHELDLLGQLWGQLLSRPSVNWNYPDNRVLGALLFQNRQLLLRRVQLIDLVTTLQ